MTRARRASLVVALVGPCAAGKTTLVTALRERGWHVRQPAQEHSGVPDLWLHLCAPDVLIYLDASLDTIRRHRPESDLDCRSLAVLEARLAHARASADLVHNLDGESVPQTLRALGAYLEARLAESS